MSSHTIQPTHGLSSSLPLSDSASSSSAIHKTNFLNDTPNLFLHARKQSCIRYLTTGALDNLQIGLFERHKHFISASLKHCNDINSSKLNIRITSDDGSTISPFACLKEFMKLNNDFAYMHYIITRVSIEDIKTHLLQTLSLTFNNCLKVDALTNELMFQICENFEKDLLHAIVLTKKVLLMNRIDRKEFLEKYIAIHESKLTLKDENVSIYNKNDIEGEIESESESDVEGGGGGKKEPFIQKYRPMCLDIALYFLQNMDVVIDRFHVIHEFQCNDLPSVMDVYVSRFICEARLQHFVCPPSILSEQDRNLKRFTKYEATLNIHGWCAYQLLDYSHISYSHKIQSLIKKSHTWQHVNNLVHPFISQKNFDLPSFELSVTSLWREEYKKVHEWIHSYYTPENQLGLILSFYFYIMSQQTLGFLNKKQCISKDAYTDICKLSYAFLRDWKHVTNDTVAMILASNYPLTRVEDFKHNITKFINPNMMTLNAYDTFNLWSLIDKVERRQTQVIGYVSIHDVTGYVNFHELNSWSDKVPRRNNEQRLTYIRCCVTNVNDSTCFEESQLEINEKNIYPSNVVNDEEIMQSLKTFHHPFMMVVPSDEQIASFINSKRSVEFMITPRALYVLTYTGVSYSPPKITTAATNVKSRQNVIVPKPVSTSTSSVSVSHSSKIIKSPIQPSQSHTNVLLLHATTETRQLQQTSSDVLHHAPIFKRAHFAHLKTNREIVFDTYSNLNTLNHDAKAYGKYFQKSINISAYRWDTTSLTFNK